MPSSISGPMVRRTVLWIDDEVSATDATVRLLASEGFLVDCINSGADGLVKAKDANFDAVLLDLRLPDMSGLSVLENLRTSDYRTPVVVLTGYGDIQSAVIALKLGAVDFREKPVLGDQLATLLRSVLASPPDANGANARCPEFPGERHGADTPSAALLRGLLEFSGGESQTAHAIDEHPPADRLAALLLAALVAPALPLRLFLACAEGLRRLVLSEAQERTSEVRQYLIGVLTQVRHTSEDRLHPTVNDCIARLEAHTHRRPTEHAIALELGLDPAHLGRLLKTHTQLGFRAWRKGLALRRSIDQLINADTQIAQIAYAAGFEYPSQFDREFRGLFGVSPREFRHYARMVSAV